MVSTDVDQTGYALLPTWRGLEGSGLGIAEKVELQQYSIASTFCTPVPRKHLHKIFGE